MKIDSDEFIYTGRGSTALWALLKSHNKPRSKVLVPVNICEIVIPIIYKAEMVPVFYDVDEISGNADLLHIEKACNGDESILLAVHNFGIPLEIDKIAAWAKGNGIFLIEDVCNALGACYKSRLLGTWGDASIFSFGYAKIIEYGIGGALLVKDKNFEKKVNNILSSLRDYSDFYKNKNSEFQAKVHVFRKDAKLQVASVYGPLYEEYADYLLYNIDDNSVEEIKNLLNTIEVNLRSREKKANRYRNEIKSANVIHIKEVCGQIYWRYNLLVEPSVKQLLIAELRKNKLLVSTWYPPIIQLFEDRFNADKFKGSILFSQKVLNLFVDHRVSDADVTKTIEIINTFGE